MPELWYGILVFMLLVFAVTEGWDFGVGALHFFVAKTQAERRTVVAALGPLWSWHEVWLVGFGGVLFVAFPVVLATAFSGFYLALFLLLWALIGRSIALEVGGHIDDPLWQAFWDFSLTGCSALLMVLCGVAIGNVIRGVPLGEEQKFSLSFFTHFGVTGKVGLLDWYTLSTALFTVLTLLAHGATYLWMKTSGPVHDRCARLAPRLWIAVAVLLPVISALSAKVRPDLFGALLSRPIALASVVIVLAAIAAIATGLRSKNETRAFAGSCALIAGLLIGAAAASFPTLLHSTQDPQHSLTAYNAATASKGLKLAAIWWPAALLLSIGAFLFVFRYYRGKVQVNDSSGHY